MTAYERTGERCISWMVRRGVKLSTNL